MVNVRDTGQFIYQSEKQVYHAFSDPTVDGMRAGVLPFRAMDIVFDPGCTTLLLRDRLKDAQRCIWNMTVYSARDLNEGYEKRY